MCTCVRVLTPLCVCVWVWLCVRARMCVCVWLCARARACVRACVRVCVTDLIFNDFVLFLITCRLYKKQKTKKLSLLQTEANRDKHQCCIKLQELYRWKPSSNPSLLLSPQPALKFRSIKQTNKQKQNKKQQQQNQKTENHAHAYCLCTFAQ